MQFVSDICKTEAKQDRFVIQNSGICMLPVFVVPAVKLPGSVHNYQGQAGQPSVALAGKLGGCRSNRRQMRARCLSFECLLVWKNLGDLRLIPQDVEWIGALRIGTLWRRCC